jgi:hypothetical protein
MQRPCRFHGRLVTLARLRQARRSGGVLTVTSWHGREKLSRILVQMFARRALFVFLFVPLLLAGRGPASTLYACAAMGSVQAECCCPELAAESGPAQLARSCCCERVTLASVLPSASLRAEWPAPVAAELVRWLAPDKLEHARLPVQVAGGTGMARARTVESRAGPSVVILHRRLLI